MERLGWKSGCVTMEPGDGQPIETLRYLAPAPDLNDPGLLDGPHVPKALWEESRGFLDQAPDQIYSMNGSANSGSNQVWRRASMHTMLTRRRMLYSVWSTAECTVHLSSFSLPVRVSVCMCLCLCLVCVLLYKKQNKKFSYMNKLSYLP